MYFFKYFSATLVAFLFCKNVSVFGHPAREVFDNKELCELVHAVRIKLKYDLKLAGYINDVAEKRHEWFVKNVENTVTDKTKLMKTGCLENLLKEFRSFEASLAQNCKNTMTLEDFKSKANCNNYETWKYESTSKTSFFESLDSCAETVSDYLTMLKNLSINKCLIRV